MLRDSRFHLALALLLYAAVAAPVQVHCCDLLTSDGECYLRMAEWYARGDVRHALFGDWSPLGPWLTVPLVALGMVPRYAFRVMIGLWGALTVFGAWRLAGRIGVGKAWRALAACCAALLAAEFSTDHRVDLLLTGLLLLYLDASLDRRVLTSRRWALGTGAIGGFAYLAKLYALPFFAVHFPAMLLAHAWGRRWEKGWLRDFACAFALGALGCAVVAAPQVALLTCKYGRLTFGTAAQGAIAFTGPGFQEARVERLAGLKVPPPDAPNAWQDATREELVRVRQRFPSPLSSARAFWRQSRLALQTAAVIRGHLASLDEFRLGLIALVATCVVPLVVRGRRERVATYLVLLYTIAVFCGGYAFVQATDKRLFWFPMFVSLVLVFHYLSLLAGLKRLRLVVAAAGAVAVISFAFHPVRFVATLLGGPPPGREHRVVAERLAAIGVRGVVCSTNWWDGLHSAYYLGAKYAGKPASREPAEIAQEMQRAGSEVILVWNDPMLGERLARHPAFRPLGVVWAGPVFGLERYEALAFRLTAPRGQRRESK